MTRADRQLALWAYLAAAKDRAFQWGQHDCVLFAAGWLDMVTGSGIYADVIERYAYADAAGAAKVIAAAAGGLQGLVTGYLGASVNVAQCGAGDVVMVKVPLGDAMVIHDGAQLLGLEAAGLARVPFQLAITGWKVRCPR